jgi:DNA-directed RNA polymerase subunit M/transcription elongation factor TFIIS
MTDIYGAVNFTEEKNLTSLLKEYTDLSDKQIKDILNVRREDGTVSLRIDTEENDDLGFVYEIIGMIKQYGFEKTYTFVKNSSSKIKDKQILESDIFEEQKKKYNDDTVKLRTKVKVKSTGIFTCPRCNEKDTSYTEVQLRSGDEGSTFIIACNACGYQFKRNS